ncbi:MAG: hypothetical protein Q7P63_09115 [Verrucomicrobiota bacterium JB022]|nr:hypothetical protein [Verrucomicrobiota bacterium JB022]
MCPPAEVTRELEAWRHLAEQRGEVWHEWLPGERGSWRGVSRWRQRLANLAESLRGPRIWIFHDGWGADLLPPAGEDDWRVALLHAPYPQLRFIGDYLARYVHAFVLPDEATKAQLRQAIRWLPERLLHVQALPLVWRPTGPVEEAAAPSQDVMGFNGWVRRPQQRVERLLVLVRLLREAGWAGRFEVLGQGPDVEWLEKQARKQGVDLQIVPPPARDFAPEALAHWRYAWSVSSFEATPLARLEAWAAGVIPIYPEEAETPHSPALADCRYPYHEMEAAVQVWQALEQRSGFAWQGLAAAGQDVLWEHMAAVHQWPQTLEGILGQRKANLARPPVVGWWPQMLYQQRYRQRLWGRVGA